MANRRLALLGGGLVVIAMLAAAIVVAPSWVAGSTQAQAQEAAQGSTMEQRLDQVIRTLQQRDAGAEAVRTAIEDGMEVLYGGLRPLPSKGDALDQTEAAHQTVTEMETKFAKALETFSTQGRATELRGMALDVKLFIEQMNEVAEAVGQFTRQCGEGDALGQPPCDDLHPLLDEATGHEFVPEPRTGEPGLIAEPVGSHIPFIRRSFSVKLRGPAVPPWFVTPGWEEDVLVTDPIDMGQCVVVFKETRGLMVRLHLERMTVVRDPWVSTFGVPRGTLVPIWFLEWVPSQYVKEWNICNTGEVTADGSVKAKIDKTVTQRVKQDLALNYFWKFYPRNR